MSHNLENNKILAAILVAGIVAMLAGFVAKQLVHPHELEKSVLEIDTSALEAASGGAAAPAGPEPILGLLATADTKRGEALSKACLACHTFDQGGANKIGPNLYGIVNNHKAHAAGFAYSDTIKGMAEKGETWTYQNLNHFLWKPAAYAKGTKMAYPGLKKPQDRADVIGYLRTLAGSPAALPSQADIAAETPVEADAKAAENTASSEAAMPTAPAQKKHGGTDMLKPVDPAAASGDTAAKKDPAKINDSSISNIDDATPIKSAKEAPADQTPKKIQD